MKEVDKNRIKSILYCSLVIALIGLGTALSQETGLMKRTMLCHTNSDCRDDGSYLHQKICRENPFYQSYDYSSYDDINISNMEYDDIYNPLLCCGNGELLI